MTRVDFSDEAFADALDRFGGDLSAWPADMRAKAEQRLAQSPDAAKAYELAERLEAALAIEREATQAQPTFSLTERILGDAASVQADFAGQSAPTPMADRPSGVARLFAWLTETSLSPATACVAGLAFGFWLGVGDLNIGAAETALSLMGEPFDEAIYAPGELADALDELGLEP